MLDGTQTGGGLILGGGAFIIAAILMAIIGLAQVPLLATAFLPMVLIGIGLIVAGRKRNKRAALLREAAERSRQRAERRRIEGG